MSISEICQSNGICLWQNLLGFYSYRYDKRIRFGFYCSLKVLLFFMVDQVSFILQRLQYWNLTIIDIEDIFFTKLNTPTVAPMTYNQLEALPCPFMKIGYSKYPIKDHRFACQFHDFKLLWIYLKADAFCVCSWTSVVCVYHGRVLTELLFFYFWGMRQPWQLKSHVDTWKHTQSKTI